MYTICEKVMNKSTQHKVHCLKFIYRDTVRVYAAWKHKSFPINFRTQRARTRTVNGVRQEGEISDVDHGKSSFIPPHTHTPPIPSRNGAWVERVILAPEQSIEKKKERNWMKVKMCTRGRKRRAHAKRRITCMLQVGDNTQPASLFQRLIRDRRGLAFFNFLFFFFWWAAGRGVGGLFLYCGERLFVCPSYFGLPRGHV